MLFDPARHEALGETTWDEARAREAIRAIVRDVERQRSAGGLWPVHPLDDEGDMPRTGFKGLYLGAAGVLWAVWYLQRAGAVQTGFDPVEGIRHAWSTYLDDPDTGQVVPSYFLGEAGILLVLWRLTGSAEAADRLYAAIESNIGNPALEPLWAAPGTMVAAWHLWQATSDPRWRGLYLANVEHLWRTWHYDEQARCYLWTQDLYDRVVQYLGAAHGFAGNAYALLKGAGLLDADRRKTLYERCVQTLRATVRFEDDAANWPPGTFAPRQDGPVLLMQWCHGSPGIVTAMRDFPPRRSADMEAMLVAAGEAVWRAGPLAKGAGLCHGTAGNGHALLELHRRTGDATWLRRARAFAMHAVTQRERLCARYGHGRFTLWTGDPGLAVYLWQCIAGNAALPALDVID